MRSPLRVLLLEDNSTDAELTLLTLAAEKIACNPLRIETRADFIAALEQQTFDLILSDHRLPSFDGLSALAIAREKSPDTPFIFVSGTIGEELAIETLKGGATDYVLKHRLSRLAPSVRRAISEFDERTARQRAESAWREADALFRSVFESSAVGIAVLDAGQRFIKTNGALQRMFKYSEDQLSTMTLTALTHADDRKLDENVLAEISAGTRSSYQVEKRYHRQDGGIMWGRLTVSQIQPSDKKEFTVAFLEDVSARKNLEQQLVESQKMEAVGRLAAGIAHDFNNVLTVISGYTGLLLARVPAQDALRQEITEISEATERATALTKRLLAFGRQDIQPPKVLNLNAILSDLDHMLRRVIGDEIRLVTQLAPDLGNISADQVQIEQVLINLIINARDAMAGGGEITVITENVHEPNAGRNGVVPGDSIMLAVADTGHGMDEATKARIFEPFFTTKEVGKGTGLGLWTVREIVQQSRGTILVESQAGRGTTFKIFFPCAPQERALAAASDPISTPAAGNETILEDKTAASQGHIVVADDDAGIRKLLCGVLRSSGYYVLEAANGKQAVDHIRREHVDLLVTDLVMPDQEGIQTIGEVRKRFPSLRIMAMSGGYGAHFLDIARKVGADHIIRKPFETGEICEAIRSLLAHPKG